MRHKSELEYDLIESSVYRIAQKRGSPHFLVECGCFDGLEEGSKLIKFESRLIQAGREHQLVNLEGWKDPRNG
jgi:hypothetical protein